MARILIRLKRTGGFSLVGVLVSAALMGFIAMLLSQVITNSKKGQVGVQNSVDFDILKTTVNLLLSKPDLCSVAFKNASGGVAKFSHPSAASAADRASKLRLGASNVVAVGQSLGGGLKVTKMQLTRVAGTAPNYLVALVMEAQKSAALGGQKISNSANPFHLSIRTDSSDRIVACSEKTTLADADATMNYQGLGPGGRITWPYSMAGLTEADGSIHATFHNSSYVHLGVFAFTFSKVTGMITFSLTGKKCARAGSANIMNNTVDVSMRPIETSCNAAASNTSDLMFVKARYNSGSDTLTLSMIRNTDPGQTSILIKRH